jgi:GNAT superfamily N-acetyltransferase
MEFRYSTEEDLEMVKELFLEQFGERPNYVPFNDFEGRYLLAFDGEKVVGMTGLNKSGYYNGLEVDWTCVKEDYKRQGIMTQMFEVLFQNCQSDVYCSAWHLSGKDRANLHSILARFGFVIAIPEYKKADTRYFACKEICKNYNGGDCSCLEDLYVRKII